MALLGSGAGLVWLAVVASIIVGFGGGIFTSTWFVAAVHVGLIECYRVLACVNTGVGGGKRRNGVAPTKSNAVS